VVFPGRLRLAVQERPQAQSPPSRPSKAGLLCGRETISVIHGRFTSFLIGATLPKTPARSKRYDGDERTDSASRKDITYFRQSITYLSWI